jgi:catechol 2,3-dioxygenase-like lactoylglutathione lyase family enzyme
LGHEILGSRYPAARTPGFPSDPGDPLSGGLRPGPEQSGYCGAVDVLGLDHVQLAAPPGCEQEARAFFGRLLGLSEIEKPEPLRARGGVWFAVGEQQLHVGVDEGFTPALKAHPALRVGGGHDLAVLAERLVEAGASVHWDDALVGVQRFYTEDPWGNRIEIVAGS